MTELSRITDDGFRIPDRGGRLLDLGLLSLKIALKSYFSTYRSMKYSLHIFEPNSGYTQDNIDRAHGYGYFEACTETIIHFQHFTELFVKEALRKEHPLLANEAASKPLILYKLLKRKPISSSEQENINTIEFREAFTRFISLLDAGDIKDGSLQFVKDYEKPLGKLSVLRNRMWHRGTFILRYPTLDEYIGKYILPFINDISKLRRYSRLVDLWKYNALQCAIDPITEITNALQNNAYNIGKIALLKELGRAAYTNPIREGPFSKPLNREIIARAERIATGEANGPDVERISICPVCGVKSLVIYSDIYSNADDLGDGEVLKEPYEAWRYTCQVKCICCAFEIHKIDIDNPSTYGLPIEDYWQSTQIQ
jgi:hypothetical protein